jgi:hypothetical protein
VSASPRQHRRHDGLLIVIAYLALGACAGLAIGVIAALVLP